MTKPKYYILESDHSVTPTDDIMVWGGFLDSKERIVSQEIIGNAKVSTVFLGLDHSFGGPIPILFETMVFGGEFDNEQERYATWDEAVAGHKRWVQKCT